MILVYLRHCSSIFYEENTVITCFSISWCINSKYYRIIKMPCQHLTNYVEQSCSCEVTSSSSNKKFTTFYRTWRFITMSTQKPVICPCPDPDQSNWHPTNPITLISIFTPSLGLPSGPFPSHFPTKPCMYLSSSSLSDTHHTQLILLFFE